MTLEQRQKTAVSSSGGATSPDKASSARRIGGIRPPVSVGRNPSRHRLHIVAICRSVRERPKIGPLPRDRFVVEPLCRLGRVGGEQVRQDAGQLLQHVENLGARYEAGWSKAELVLEDGVRAERC
jgi:hypothetical protein